MTRPRGGMGGSSYVSNAPGTPNFRDRIVRSRKVPCRSCGAEVDSPCRSAPGNVLPAGHRIRRADALRAGL